MDPNAGPIRFLQTAPYRPPGRTAFHAKQSEVFHCPSERIGRYVHIRTHADGHHHLVCEVEVIIKYRVSNTHHIAPQVKVTSLKIFPHEWKSLPAA